MSANLIVAVVTALLLSITPALAHSPIMGIGGVLGGVLHALLIPEHGMSLVALGLAVGQLETPARRAGLVIFALVLTSALVGSVFAIGEMLAADVLLVVTGLLGLLIITMWTPASLVVALAAIVGLCLGLDSRPEVSTTSEAIQMLLGNGLGATMALAMISEVSFRLRCNAQRIVARVMGSWITAIAILVLSLRIVTQLTVG
jgi:HupE / UreJ protein